MQEPIKIFDIKYSQNDRDKLHKYIDQIMDEAFLSNMQKVLFGILIIFLLIRQPEGVLSILNNWWQKVVLTQKSGRVPNKRRSVK